jgi:hypothetical protein
LPTRDGTRDQVVVPSAGDGPGSAARREARRGTLVPVALPVPWTNAFIHAPADRVEAARASWSEVTGCPLRGAGAAHPEYASLVPTSGAPNLHVQTIGGQRASTSTWPATWTGRG